MLVLGFLLVAHYANQTAPWQSSRIAPQASRATLVANSQAEKLEKLVVTGAVLDTVEFDFPSSLRKEEKIERLKNDLGIAWRDSPFPRQSLLIWRDGYIEVKPKDSVGKDTWTDRLRGIFNKPGEDLLWYIQPPAEALVIAVGEKKRTVFHLNWDGWDLSKGGQSGELNVTFKHLDFKQVKQEIEDLLDFKKSKTSFFPLAMNLGQFVERDLSGEVLDVVPVGLKDSVPDKILDGDVILIEEGGEDKVVPYERQDYNPETRLDFIESVKSRVSIVLGGLTSCVYQPSDQVSKDPRYINVGSKKPFSPHLSFGGHLKMYSGQFHGAKWTPLSPNPANPKDDSMSYLAMARKWGQCVLFGMGRLKEGSSLARVSTPREKIEIKEPSIIVLASQWKYARSHGLVLPANRANENIEFFRDITFAGTPGSPPKKVGKGKLPAVYAADGLFAKSTAFEKWEQDTCGKENVANECWFAKKELKVIKKMSNRREKSGFVLIDRSESVK